MVISPIPRKGQVCNPTFVGVTRVFVHTTSFGKSCHLPSPRSSSSVRDGICESPCALLQPFALLDMPLTCRLGAVQNTSAFRSRSRNARVGFWKSHHFGKGFSASLAVDDHQTLSLRGFATKTTNTEEACPSHKVVPPPGTRTLYTSRFVELRILMPQKVSMGLGCHSVIRLNLEIFFVSCHWWLPGTTGTISSILVYPSRPCLRAVRFGQNPGDFVGRL